MLCYVSSPIYLYLPSPDFLAINIKTKIIYICPSLSSLSLSLYTWYAPSISPIYYLYLNLSLSLYLSIGLSIYLSVGLSIFLYIFFFSNPLIYISCLSLYPALSFPLPLSSLQVYVTFPTSLSLCLSFSLFPVPLYSTSLYP